MLGAPVWYWSITEVPPPGPITNAYQIWTRKSRDAALEAYTSGGAGCAHPTRRITAAAGAAAPAGRAATHTDIRVLSLLMRCLLQGKAALARPSGGTEEMMPELLPGQVTPGQAVIESRSIPAGRRMKCLAARWRKRHRAGLSTIR